ncbi:MAG: CYTH domain-containing protein [Bacilli bacterium]|nr:CYTH domain-containing protein [Bacilli bacterium]
MVNAQKEFETRLLISEEQYFFIVTYYMNIQPNKHFLQNANHYFDTDDLFLRNQHMTLRVRIINDIKSELTLKIKGENGDDEITDGLTPKEQELLLEQNIFPYGQVRNRLMLLPYSLDKYHRIASLYNRRLEIEQEDHTLVIDKNTYGDIVDYNLEIESKIGIDHAKDLLKMYAEKFNLTLSKEKYIGKARRAIDEALKKLNND